MKIERDKWYLTRNGRKVFVIYTEANDSQPIVGVWEDGDVGKFCPNGRFYSTVEHSLYDLVSEYVEPPKPREIWVNVNSSGLYGFVWTTQEDAKAFGGGQLTAVLFREVIE